MPRAKALRGGGRRASRPERRRRGTKQSLKRTSTIARDAQGFRKRGDDFRQRAAKTGNFLETIHGRRAAHSRPRPYSRNALRRTNQSGVVAWAAHDAYINERSAKGRSAIRFQRIEHESVVRVRIVTTLDNLIALRDLLNSSIRQTPAPSASSGAVKVH
jgi:hypothetical protein